MSDTKAEAKSPRFFANAAEVAECLKEGVDFLADPKLTDDDPYFPGMRSRSERDMRVIRTARLGLLLLPLVIELAAQRCPLRIDSALIGRSFAESSFTQGRDCGQCQSCRARAALAEGAR